MVHKQTYSGTKFIVSIPGFLKITAAILFLTSSAMFLITPICGESSSWPGKLYPISGTVSGIAITLMYVVFAAGFTKRNYEVWILIDLILNMMDFILMLIVSIVTLSHCSGSGPSLQIVPAPMGIIGAVLLATSSAVWFAQSRERSDVAFTTEINDQQPHIYRKSIMV